MTDKMKHKRPPMKQVQHPAHNMPAPEHDGTPMPTTPIAMPPMSQQVQDGSQDQPAGMQGY